MKFKHKDNSSILMSPVKINASPLVGYFQMQNVKYNEMVAPWIIAIHVVHFCKYANISIALMPIL